MARVIVKFKADAGSVRALSAGPQAAGLSRRLGIALSDGRALGARSQLLTAGGLSSRELADRLAALPEVEYAVPDERRRAVAVPNDPLYLGGEGIGPSVGQWYLRAPAGSVVSGINAEGAWQVATGSEVVIAVLDTGVRADHPDLKDKLLPGYDFIDDPATANDGNGRDADASDPGDWISVAENATGPFAGCGTEFSSWHGTQTAGLVGAATNNGIGMAGTGRDVKVLPVRVLGKCGGQDSDIIDGMRWAAGLSVPNVPANPHPAKVLNLSLGSSGACSAAYRDVMGELTVAGVVVVAAAGNDSGPVGAPANCAGVVAVAGLRHAGDKVGYSSFGSEVTIAAPAGNCVDDGVLGPCRYPILSTSDTGHNGPQAATYTNDGANAGLGTSFSAPLVAGTVGLMMSADRTLAPGGVIDALRRSARPFPSTGGSSDIVASCDLLSSGSATEECYCSTNTCGAGMLDAAAAVSLVARTTAHITASAASVPVGSDVTLDGSASSTQAGRQITAWQWTISAGSGIASFSSATNASTATLHTLAPGSVTVTLTVTDDASRQATASSVISVTAGPSSGSPPASSPSASSPSTGQGGSDSGGGALGMVWLAGLLVAVSLVRGRAART